MFQRTRGCYLLKIILETVETRRSRRVENISRRLRLKILFNLFNTKNHDDSSIIKIHSTASFGSTHKESTDNLRSRTKTPEASYLSFTDRPTNQPTIGIKEKKKKKMVKKARRKVKKKKLRERCAFNVKGHSTGISYKGRWFGQDRKHRPTEFSFPPRELRLVRLPPP